MYLHAYISASAAKNGTLHVRDVTMDATNNIWSVWGTGYGPGLTGSVYGQVEGVTYLVDEGAVLSDLLDSRSPYAADTKPGTTIVFAAGTYVLDGTLPIGKDVALVGAGADKTVFQATAEPTVLLEVSGGDVDFSMSGIHVKGVDANSHNNSSAIQIGSNALPNTGNLTIEACRFSNFTKNSMTVKGGTAAITGNTIDCKPYPGAAGNGIQIDMGAEAVITGNTINGYVSYSDSWSACGVLVLRDGRITRIRDNTIADCATGIMKETYYDTEGDRTYLDVDAAKNNTFTGCAQNVDFEFDLLEEIEAYAGGAIRLPCDVTLEEKLTISKDLVLDGNGFTIYGQEDDPSVSIEVTAGTFRISDVTLKDFGGAAEGLPGAAVIRIPSTADPDTALIAADVHVVNFHGSAYDIGAGTFSITGGTIDCAHSNAGTTGLASGIRAGGTAGKVTGIISRVTVTASGDRDGAGWGAVAMEIRSNADVEVTGCVIDRVHTGIRVENDRQDASGGITVAVSGTDLTAREDAVLLSGSSGTGSQAAVHITGGSYTGGLRTEDPTGHSTLSITGGRFSADPTAYVAPGYCVTASGGAYLVHSEDTDILPDGDGTPDGDGSEEGDSDGDDSEEGGSDGEDSGGDDSNGGGSGDNGSSGGGSPDDTAPPKPSDPETSGGNTTVSTQVKPTISGGTAAAEIDAGVMDQAVESVLEAATESDTAPVVQILVDSGEASRVEVRLPVSALDTLGGHALAALTVISGAAAVTLDSAAITAVASQARGEQVTLAVAPVAAADLNAQQQAAVGSAPVFELHLKSDGTAIPHFGGGSATVSIPHTLSHGQTAEGVAVYHLDDLGALTLRSTSYDETSGKVTFTTPHFSKYVVKHQDSSLSQNPFIDVSEADYFYPSVLWAAEQGITLGTSPTTFSPYRVCTRARAVMFLWRAAGSPRPASTDNPFTDVRADADYYDAVLWAVEQGITAGTSLSTFSPDAPCTRAQIVTFLWRYSRGARAKTRNFTDVAQDAYYYEAVLWAARHGITTGVTETLFSPDAPCTRAQMVTFLFRYSAI